MKNKFGLRRRIREIWIGVDLVISFRNCDNNYPYVEHEGSNNAYIGVNTVRAKD